MLEKDKPSNLSILLPVGTLISINPKKIKEANYSIYSFSDTSEKLIEYDSSYGDTIYKDSWVDGLIIDYVKIEDDLLHEFVVLEPDRDLNLLLYIKIPVNIRGNLEFARLFKAS